MRVLRIAAAVAILTIAVPCAPVVSALDLREKVDPLARPLVDDGLVVGLAIGILKDGQTQFIAYGETTKGSGTVPTADTIYEIGSISKVFTGTLLADMVERGKVQLSDPIQQYVPAGIKVPMFDDKPITIENLATHTSGLPRLPKNLNPADAKNPYADYTVEQMYAFLARHKLRRAPGEYEYSNYGMGLLGQLLAARADTTYAQLLAQRITQPLGMSDTVLELSDQQRSRLAPPYNAALAAEHTWDIPTLAGAGAIRSTVADMLRFAEANLAADDDRKDELPLARAMRLAQQKRFDIKGGLAIGLGWHIARDRFTRWHNGMTGGYASWLAVVPGHGIGVVVLSNTATERITQLGEQITRVAVGSEVKPPPRPATVEVDPAVLASYAGNYTILPGFGLTVTVEDGRLMVQATGQDTVRVLARSKTEFFYTVVDAQITFVPGEDGKVTKLILHQNGLDLDAMRVP